MTRRYAALFSRHLARSGGFCSYDPIRCQEPQWPRRPLAIGRRGLPLTRPGPPPACHRRLRLSLISADTVLSARTPFLRRGSPSLSRRMRRAPRAQRNRGYPRRPPGSPGRGLCLFRALRHIVPRAQSHLTSSAAVAALAFAWGMPRASISSRRRRSRSDPFLPCILISRGTPVSLGMSFGWCRAAA